jgi:phosphohistidine phosphatase
MQFYLVRHGDAVSAVEDPRRPLSAAGRADIERLARWALEREVRVAVIYHSGILRAAETAAILAARLGPPAGVKEHSGLLPEDDPAIAKAELESTEEPIMLVGHLPHMNRLAGLLFAGDPNRAAAEFATATMLGGEWNRGNWKILWKSPQSFG